VKEQENLAKTLKKPQNSIFGTLELNLITCLQLHKDYLTLQQILKEIYKKDCPATSTEYKKSRRSIENLCRKQFVDKKTERIGKQDIVSYKLNHKAVDLVFLLHTKNYIKDNKNLAKLDRQLGLRLLKVFDIF